MKVASSLFMHWHDMWWCVLWEDAPSAGSLTLFMAVKLSPG